MAETPSPDKSTEIWYLRRIIAGLCLAIGILWNRLGNEVSEGRAEIKRLNERDRSQMKEITTSSIALAQSWKEVHYASGKIIKYQDSVTLRRSDFDSPAFEQPIRPAD